MIYVVPIPEAELRSYLAVKAIAEASAKKADDDRVKASDAWSNLQFKLRPEPVKESQRKNLGEACEAGTRANRRARMNCGYTFSKTLVHDNLGTSAQVGGRAR